MDAGKRAASAAADWADLPSELLEIIYGNLKDFPAEKFRFRWVCRWWRLSTLPPPNILSAWFPLEPSVIPILTITASSVYLVRSRSDPTKACLVSLHEASAGNLDLRHPLFYNRISDSGSDSSADAAADWIIANQKLISRSYAYSEICDDCDHISRRLKVAIVVDSSSRSGFVGVCGFRRRMESLDRSGMELMAFSSDFTGGAIPAITDHRIHSRFFLGDFATFNGRIFAVDKRRRIYALDHKSLSLIQLNAITLPSGIISTVCSTVPYLVVSDGDIYLVSMIFDMPNNCNTCQIHRLQVMNNHQDQEVSVEVEEVEDLGDDRVFFIGLTNSFSVSARDLPPPWKGNCIVYHDHQFRCECYIRPTCADHQIIFLGGGQRPRSASVSSLQGYSDLLSAEPLLQQIKDLDHKAALTE